MTAQGHAHDHGHNHGLVDESIRRSRDGLRGVGLALLILAATAIAQTLVFVASGSVALLADLIRSSPTARTPAPTPTSASPWSPAPLP